MDYRVHFTFIFAYQKDSVNN